MHLAFLAAMLLAPQAPATSDGAKIDPQPQASAGGAPVAKKKDRKVCRTMSLTGSLMKGEKVCMTEKQWRDQE
jgi:hypothetical protein